jgi:Peptidase family M28
MPTPIRALPLAILVAACATAGTVASNPDAPTGLPMKYAARPTTGEIRPADLMSRLYVLADDSMMGREAGTLGNVKGTDFVAAEMRRIGLEPAGENGTYFQTVPVTITRIDSGRTISVDGAPLVLGRDVVPFMTAAIPRGGTLRSLDGVKAVFGGDLGGPVALIAPAKAAGRLVVFTLMPGANGRRDTRALATAGLASYADAAGIAVVLLDAIQPAAISRLLAPQTRVRVDASGTGPVGMLLSPAAASRLLGVSSLADLEPRLIGADARTVSGTLAYVETAAAYPSRNVVGIVRGSDATLRGEYVAVGAHNDHIGLERRPLDHDSVLAFNMVVRRQGVQDTVAVPTPAQASRIAVLRDSLTRAHGGPRADSVNNGADDDGSGTVAMLEIAERFATASSRPKRSLLFVSHVGEEKGLWGSAWFTDHPTVPRDSIVAQLNMDMVGRGKPTDIMGRGPNNVQVIGWRRLSTQLGNLIDSLNMGRTPQMAIDTSFDTHGHPLNRYCRSDHYEYARWNIPITYFSLGYHTDYHQVTDEPQYIDYGHMARIAQFVHDVAEAVANRPERLVVDGPRMDPKGGCRQ